MNGFDSRKKLTLMVVFLFALAIGIGTFHHFAKHKAEPNGAPATAENQPPAQTQPAQTQNVAQGEAQPQNQNKVASTQQGAGSTAAEKQSLEGTTAVVGQAVGQAVVGTT